MRPRGGRASWSYQHQRDRGSMAVTDVAGWLTGREPTRLGVELGGVFTKSEDRGQLTSATATGA